MSLGHVARQLSVQRTGRACILYVEDTRLAMRVCHAQSTPAWRRCGHRQSSGRDGVHGLGHRSAVVGQVWRASQTVHKAFSVPSAFVDTFSSESSAYRCLVTRVRTADVLAERALGPREAWLAGSPAHLGGDRPRRWSAQEVPAMPLPCPLRLLGGTALQQREWERRPRLRVYL